MTTPCRIYCVLAVLAAVFGSRQISASTNIWTGGSGTDTNWSNVTNWSGGVPNGGDDVKFFDAGSTTTSNVNNVVDASFAGYIGSLQYGNTNNAHTTLIAAGRTLSITNGNLVVGTLGDVGAARNLTNTIIGTGGTLLISNTNAVIALNQGTATSVTGTRANLDLSGLDTFIANVNAIGLGSFAFPNPGSTSLREAGALFLAKSNYISLNLVDTLAHYQTNGFKNALEMSRNANVDAGIPSVLYLGITNVFYADSFGFGRDRASTSAPAVMQFNPSFKNSNPSAYFRGIGGGGSRIKWWAIGDMNNSVSSSVTSNGTNDFSGGAVDALVDIMSLGRDSKLNQTANGTNSGTLKFTAGTIDVNTLYVGNQSLGPSTSTTGCSGTVSVNGPGAVLKVNDLLVLGNTTTNSVAASNTSGMLNIFSNATVYANTITVGAFSTNSSIAMGDYIGDSASHGTLVVSNTIASPAHPLRNLRMTNSTLAVRVSNSTNICVLNLMTGGATNIIIPISVTVFDSYPTQQSIITYAAVVGGVGFNFGFGTNSLPATAPGAYLTNNVFAQSVGIALPVDPRPFFTAPPAGTNIILNVGANLATSCTAMDANVPAQTFIYSLLAGPSGMTLNSTNGNLTWRPSTSATDTTNTVTVVATDNLPPNLSVTNSFTVTVNPLPPTTIDSTSLTGGQFSVSVSGQIGPDYALQATTNLTSGIWTTIAVTNSPLSSPFVLTDTNAVTAPEKFYRIVAGPPFP